MTNSLYDMSVETRNSHGSESWNVNTLKRVRYGLVDTGKCYLLIRSWKGCIQHQFTGSGVLCVPYQKLLITVWSWPSSQADCDQKY